MRAARPIIAPLAAAASPRPGGSLLRRALAALVVAALTLAAAAAGATAGSAGGGAAGGAFGGSAGARAETRLLMFESPGCPWCAAWEAEIGPAYAASPEGRRAPLERLRLGTEPEGAALAAPPRITPTFVLVHDGVEVGRIEGYPGAAFFWPMLGRLLERLPAADEAAEGEASDG